ncbi:MAG TPA: pre-peptidase C-terminal domain-containing protein [Humisphaera sp.]
MLRSAAAASPARRSTRSTATAARPRVARASAGAAPVVESLEGRALMSVSPDPGSNAATAYNLGDLNGSRTVDDFVGQPDGTDYYKFTMPRAGRFVSGVRSQVGELDLILGREDVGPDGSVAVSFVDSIVAGQQTPSGPGVGALPARTLAAGTYYLIVGARNGNSFYDLRLTADTAGDNFGTARDVGSAVHDAYTEFVGRSPDPAAADDADTFRVKMDADGVLSLNAKLDVGAGTPKARLELLRDSNGDGQLGQGDTIADTDPGTDLSLLRVLPAGTYFARVVAEDGASNYNLLVDADYTFGPMAPQSRFAGSLDAGKTFADYLSASGDKVDAYRFTLSAARQVYLVSSQEDSGTHFLRLYRDANNDGVAQPIELVKSSSNKSFNALLVNAAAGQYIVQTEAASGAGKYTLFAEARPDAAGNTPGAAKALGTVNGLRRLDDYVSVSDRADFYKFTTSAAGTVSAQLSPGIGGNPDLVLVRDANLNGKVDAGEVLAASSLTGSQQDRLTKSLPAGTYFLGVTFNDPEGASKYNLTFHTDYAGSSQATARNVGALVGTRAFDDWASMNYGGVISDPVDLYKVTLTSAKTLTAKLAGSQAGQDLALQLYKDKNGNGVLDAGELLAASDKVNTANEQVTKALAAGTYFVRVVGLNGDTNYKLSLTA